jgi:hypothetical protein
MESHKERFPSARRGVQVLHGFRDLVASQLAARRAAFVATDRQRPPEQMAEVYQQAPPVTEGPTGDFTTVSPPTEQMANVAASEPMDQSWVSMQDFGQNDWMLRFGSDAERH